MTLRAAAPGLAAWYRAQARDLPWRRDPDPYRVLVSEVMLQQTTVGTVIPYFRRFVARWPDARALAAAREEEILAAWSGLGYYHRARNLLRAARAVVVEHGGVVPSDPEALRRLPGIGPYTASAILAIAFGRKEIALDGNLRRVLARLAALRSDPRSRAGERTLREAGLALAEAADPSTVNQALMDIGATICLPIAPRCRLCPLAPACAARRLGIQDRIPASRRRVSVTEVRLVAALVRRRGRVLLRRRGGDLMAGLWEIPMAPLPRAARPELAAAAMLRRLGIGHGALSRGAIVRHAITRHRILVEVVEGAALRVGAVSASRGETGAPSPAVRIAGEAEAVEHIWASMRGLGSRALTGIARKILGAAGAPRDAGTPVEPARGRRSSEEGPAAPSRGAGDQVRLRKSFI